MASGHQHILESVAKIHELRRTLTEDVFYPPHPPRTETSEYKAIHKKLVHELDLPCLVCGVRQSTLEDSSQNRWGARALETHHHHIEWALAGAIDLGKFNARIVLAYRKRPGHHEQYDSLFTQEQLLAWVDHDPDNLWVLCDVHHRHKGVGIHAISGPIWGTQDLVLDNFKLTPETPSRAAEAFQEEGLTKQPGE